VRARADLARVLDNFPGLDPHLACPVYTQLAEAALWEKRPGDARHAITAGLRAVEGNDHPAYVIPLCRAGLAAAAAAAQQARARRDSVNLGQSKCEADHLIETARAITRRADTELTPVTEAELLTAEAEYARLGSAGPQAGAAAPAWDRAAAAWARVCCPYPQGYARWRQAELELAGSARPAASAALAQARHLAGSLPARRLVQEIEALAARARITLPDAGPPAADSPEPGVPLGLTSRELDVLRLLAVGRTNRQIGAELFISPRTVGVHVSHILAKLGAASRVEAAAVAHSLDLTSPAAPARR